MMSVTATKSNGSLSVYWSAIGYGIQPRVVIIIRDVTSQSEWFVTPTSHTLTRLKVKISEPQCSEHTFEVQVFCCELIPGSNGFKVVYTDKTTASSDLESLFAHRMPAVHRYAESAAEVELSGWATSTLSEPLRVRLNGGELVTVIDGGVSLPTSRTCRVSTERDYHSFETVEVYSGRSRLADLNRHVGVAHLGIPEHLQHIPMKLDFDLTLNVDANGQVTVSTTGRAARVRQPLEFEDKILCDTATLASTMQSDVFSKPVLSIQRSTYSQASLSWNRCAPQPDSWLVTVTRLDYPTSTCYFLLDGRSTSLDLPFSFCIGKRYKVTLTALRLSGSVVDASATCYRMFVGNSEEFRAELNKLTVADIRQLYDKAINNCSRYQVTPCNWLYRNRWPAYFDEIFNKHHDVMKVYDKDNSGDQASPINGQIKGLFFMGKNENGQPPPDSPFGSVRIQVPPRVLLDITPNVYFVDFYCMRGKIHYVTLVLTRSGSEADIFCRDRLLPLDLYDRSDNPFLFWEGGQLWVNNTYYLLVELFYTEDIDIVDLVNNHGAKFIKNIPTIGKGRSTPGGVPKNPACSVCNLNRAHVRGLTTL